MADVGLERSKSIEAAGLAALGLAHPPESQGRLAWERFRQHRLAMGSAVVLVVLIGVCLAAPWIAPYDFTALRF